VNAFLYLALTSARNRIWVQLRRARSPRYAVALVAAFVYVWWFLIRPSQSEVGEIFLTRPAETIVALLIVIMLSSAWLFGSDKLALAFTPAEVSLLFPAPLSRRALTGYKLYRAQVAVLINALVWVFLLRRGNVALPAAARALALWVMFSTLNLHRLGAALVQSAWREHGRSGARRNAWSILFFAVVALMLLAGLVLHRERLMAANDAGEFFLALTDVLRRAPASYGLLPFTLVVAPSFALSVSEWLRAMPLALGVMALHLWWVLRTDVAFEDAAIEASAARAKRREQSRGRRGLGEITAPKGTSTSLRLRPTGHPGWAIVWKNLICLRRTSPLRLLVAPLALSLVVGAATSGGGSDPATFVAAAALTFGVMLLVFGGRMIRNDLRHDMLNLPLLKSLPVSASDLVLAEVASSTLPMAALQLALVIVAFVASLGMERQPLPLDVRVAILVGAPFGAIALNGAQLAIQNGLAVLFPAWMRLGSAVSTGVEALGQNLIATMANVLSLAVALVLPLIIAFVGVRFLHLSGGVAIAATIIVTAIVLAVETIGAVRFVAKAFSRAEPAAV
jgi:hypothetical protein